MTTFNKTSFTITDSTFTYNSATDMGGVIWCKGSFIVNNSMFNFNRVNNSLGLMFMSKCNAHFSNSTFSNNFGSLYFFLYTPKSLSVGNYTQFENCGKSQVAGAVMSHLEGGAITSLQSVVTFMGKSSLLNNQASRGGAVLAIDSTITLFGITIIANSLARRDGGGISLRQSILNIRGNCNFSNNSAMIGGGIYATIVQLLQSITQGIYKLSTTVQ